MLDYLPMDLYPFQAEWKDGNMLDYLPRDPYPFKTLTDNPMTVDHVAFS